MHMYYNLKLINNVFNHLNLTDNAQCLNWKTILMKCKETKIDAKV